MRIIKFRALKDDMSNCRFYYGSLIYDKEGNPRIYDVDTNTFHTCIKGTEGQFTGLYDKNGKEIYEGDIVSYNHTIQNYDDDDILNPRYYKTPQHETKSFKSDVKYMYNSFTIMDNSKWNDLEVIGNSFENPELLTD